MFRFGRNRTAMQRATGFTLVELMITVAIIGILAGIAYAAYSSQMQKTRRADGKIMLEDVKAQLERCFTRYSSYNNAGCDIATDVADGGIASADGWYIITDTNAGASTYTLTATPQGVQANDTKCANLSVTHTGVRGASGDTPGACW